MQETFYTSQQHPSLLAQKIYALESPLLSCLSPVVVSRLCQQSRRLTYSWFCLLLVPALCGGYWLLVGTTWSWEADCRTPVAPMGYCRLIAGCIQGPEDPQLFSTHCQIMPGSGVSAILLAGSTMSWNVFAGSKAVVLKFVLACQRAGQAPDIPRAWSGMLRTHESTGCMIQFSCLWSLPVSV